jgi:hypothetical protein
LEYLGLHIFAARDGGAHRVTAHRISAALACTSGESCLEKIYSINISARKYSYNFLYNKWNATAGPANITDIYGKGKFHITSSKPYKTKFHPTIKYSRRSK